LACKGRRINLQSNTKRVFLAVLNIG